MIIVSNLSKQFGKLKVLEEVNLKCDLGQCIAMIGPNGSGKTTLIKCILGMAIPNNGLITFNNKDIVKDWSYRAQIGYMPQIGRYPENMTIGQLLGMMKDVRGMADAQLDDDLIKAFQLSSLINKRMSTLSGGTTQKVSAALAFLFNPSVLILDEPTAGLDPIASEILKEKIITEKEKGKLVLITSHILSDLDYLVSEVVYMQDGRILFHKSIDQIKADTGEIRLAKAIATIMNNEKNQY